MVAEQLRYMLIWYCPHGRHLWPTPIRNGAELVAHHARVHGLIRREICPECQAKVRPEAGLADKVAYVERFYRLLPNRLQDAAESIVAHFHDHGRLSQRQEGFFDFIYSTARQAAARQDDEEDEEEEDADPSEAVPPTRPPPTLGPVARRGQLSLFPDEP